MRFYFAYGANMDVETMSSRCRNARPIGAAILSRHRFVIMEPGFANVLRDGRHAVHGVLWKLPFADLPALDRYEDVHLGLYRKEVRAVSSANGAVVAAMLYVGATPARADPAPGYLENILDSATRWRMPPRYIRHLESMLAVADREPRALQA